MLQAQKALGLDKLNQEIETAYILEKYRSEIDEEIKKTLNDCYLAKSTRGLYEIMAYHLGFSDQGDGLLNGHSSGKKLRPLLCLMTCEATGGNYKRTLPIAATIELIHNFSLIHDDIEDGDEERRNRPTIWKIWGQPQAINVGDGMYSLAYSAILGLGNRNSSKLGAILEILTRTTRELCEGQYLDLSFENQTDITIDAYFEMIARKSAALIECSSYCGAMMGTDNEQAIGHYRKYGHFLGMGFQIRDDILGIWGDAEIMGKPQASDIRKKKKTLPIIYAYSRPEQKPYLEQIYQQSRLNGKDFDRVLEILDDSGAYDYCQKEAERFITKALEEFDQVGFNNPAQSRLRHLTECLIERSF